MKLISSKYVAGVDLLLDVVEAGVVSICDDGVALLFEFGEIIHHEAAEEGGAVLEGGLVDDDLGTLGFDALHHALDGALAEVVTIGFHR